MFTNIVQPNMNGVNGTPFAPNIQGNNINGQNGFDANSFIKILTAIVSGFNNTVMNLEGGLFANNDSQTITIDDISKGLFVDNDGNAVKGDALSDILQQMMSQMQMIGIPRSMIIINQDGQKTSDVLNNSTMQMNDNINGNTIANAMVNLMTKSEEEMQKVNIHTNTNSNGNFFVQVKAMTSQEPQVSMPENKIAQLPSSGAESKNTAIDSKQAAQPDLLENAAVSRNSNIGSEQYMHIKTTLNKKELESNFSVLNKNNIEPAVNISDAQTRLNVEDKQDGMVVSTAQLYHTPYAKSDSVVVAKESIHVSRLNELAEVMEKTVKAGDKHLIIKLEPPDLGSIQIKLRMDNGMLRADLKVDSPVVKDLFSMAIPQIKTSLEDSGIKVSDFFVDVKDDYYSDGGRQQDDTNQQQHKQNKESKFQFFDYFA
jgi:flagellar hook-length control protein FliK